jgi:O-antigen/teichoic acid export membrane protein
MTHVYARKGLSELMPLFLKLTRIALLMFAILLPTLFLLGKPLLLIVSGSQFLGAYPFLLVLAVAACLQVISVSCEPMLLTAGRSRAIVAIRVAGASILIAALYFSLMRFGAMGAAGARAAAELATLCMLFGASYLVLRETRASG